MKSETLTIINNSDVELLQIALRNYINNKVLTNDVQDLALSTLRKLNSLEAFMNDTCKKKLNVQKIIYEVRG